MTDTQLRAQEEWASPLFTPRERELMRELKELQQRSAEVIERLAYETRRRILCKRIVMRRGIANDEPASQLRRTHALSVG